MKSNQYNFVNQSDLPKGTYIEYELSLPNDMKWAKTDKVHIIV